MTMRSKLLLTLILLVAALPAWASDPAPAVPPDQVVQTSAKQLLTTVAAKRDDLKAHPEKLYDIAQQDLVPYFDFDYASRLVLGVAWRTASADQRKEIGRAHV